MIMSENAIAEECRITAYGVKEDIIIEIMDGMSGTERKRLFGNLRMVWCAACGGEQPEGLRGCRCEDDS